MNHLLRASLALLLGVLLTPACFADVVVRAPYVYVQVGQSTVIRVPFVNLVLPGRTTCRKTAVAPVPVPVATTPIEPGDPPPVPVEGVPSRIVPPVSTTAPPPMTVKEFASTFKPQPEGGKYEVVLKHTFTGQPVAVRFTLPPGAPRKSRPASCGWSSATVCSKPSWCASIATAGCRPSDDTVALSPSGTHQPWMN